jgi:hypothetical protein
MLCPPHRCAVGAELQVGIGEQEKPLGAVLADNTEDAIHDSVPKLRETMLPCADAETTEI